VHGANGAFDRSHIRTHTDSYLPDPYTHCHCCGRFHLRDRLRRPLSQQQSLLTAAPVFLHSRYFYIFRVCIPLDSLSMIHVDDSC
jgi:hypothetical protein